MLTPLRRERLLRQMSLYDIRGENGDLCLEALPCRTGDRAA
jgi:hypothetical protein